MTKRTNAAARGLLLALGLTVGGCSDLLTVEDPQSYSDDDLDGALEAAANGVEGELHSAMDGYVIYTALNSDVFMHTGTWIGYDNYDHGRFIYGNASGGGGGGASDGVMDDLLTTRWFAQDAVARLDRVLGEEAATSPLMAQVQSVEAWANLLLAQSFCEAPAEPEGPAVPDVAIYQLAVQELTEALGYAEAVEDQDWINFNHAGLARAHLMLADLDPGAGHLDAALMNAQAVPGDWVKAALHSENSGAQENGIVNLVTVGNNTAAGMRRHWWPMVDTVADQLIDPYTNELDGRVPIEYAPGALGVDGKTPHYSQFKYPEKGSDVPFTHSGEMRLIEAEVHWRQGNLPLALEKINGVRAEAGLGPVPDTGNPDVVFEYLLHERFAELFMEGQRMNDLHRFGLVAQFIADGAFGPESEAIRPTKFPISEAEAANSPAGIEDNAAMRCLPLSG